MRQTIQSISRLASILFVLAGILACTITIPGTSTPISPVDTVTPSPTSTVTPTVPPTATRDPRILNPENQHLYLYVMREMDWHEARDYCASLGGHLVTIESAAENSFIFQLTNGNTWLGATDEAEEGTWVWVNGQTWDYTDWDEGEPNNCCPPENCGGTTCTPEHYLTYSDTALKWNDIPAFSMSFVCEWDTK